MQGSANGAKNTKNAQGAKDAKNTNQVQQVNLNLNPALHKEGIYKAEVFGAIDAQLASGAITEKQHLMSKKSIRAKIRRQLDWAYNQWVEQGVLEKKVLNDFITWAYQIFITPTHLFDTNKVNIKQYLKFQDYINQNLPKSKSK